MERSKLGERRVAIVDSDTAVKEILTRNGV